MNIREKLFEMEDRSYLEFEGALIPTVEREKMIGIRTPRLRALAKELWYNRRDAAEQFLGALPHSLFEENNLHAYLLRYEKSTDRALLRLDEFLPYVDNWATCDGISVPSLKKDKTALLSRIEKWIKSDKVYTVRFAIKMLMDYLLDADFEEKYFDMVISACGEDYYIKMMKAWYFATALAKQYGAAVKVIEERRLDSFTHRKTISKACDSYRISDEKKRYLRSLR